MTSSHFEDLIPIYLKRGNSPEALASAAEEYIKEMERALIYGGQFDDLCSHLKWKMLHDDGDIAFNIDHADWVALEKSIAHWEENAADPANKDMNPSSCALCLHYSGGDLSGGIKCDDCIILRYTDLPLCRGTPYRGVQDNSIPPKVMLQWLKDLRDGNEPEIYED